jgi:hypothetical protein
MKTMLGLAKAVLRHFANQCATPLGAALLAGMMTVAAMAAPLSAREAESRRPLAQIDLSVLSSRPDMVTGGTALMAVRLGANTPPRSVRLAVNGVVVQPRLRPTADPAVYQVLVAGLALGRNRVDAWSRIAKGHAHIEVVNHPRTGPVFSGRRIGPFECRTAESGLGAPIDLDCSAPTRHDWFYVTRSGEPKPLPAPPAPPWPSDMATTTTSEGKTVPFIVRVESGTLNRSIYRIAVLQEPGKDPAAPPTSWNQRLILRFGESTAAQYQQGVSQVTEVFKSDSIDQQSLYALGKGYAYAVSTLNVHKVNVNDVIAAETAMMLREHVAKAYGVPRWMLGMGGSGGAIQQLLIAQNYPGILDGVMPDAAFPDVMATAMVVSDCRLLNRYFQRAPASAAVRKAVEGHTRGTCANWDQGLGDAIVATSGAATPPCGLNNSALVYDPIANPGGARCTVYDVNAGSLGRDGQGRAPRPLDNIGIEYGLAGLKQGALTAEQFVALNESVGGYDADGNLQAARTQADLAGLRRAYALGRVGSGAGGLATVPVLQMRAVTEPGGDIHTLNNDFKLRAQLQRSNGRSDNQVIWVLPHPALALLLGLGVEQQRKLEQLLHDTLLARLDLMSQWLDTLAATPPPHNPDQIAKARPASAVDACWDVATAARIDEPATYDGPGRCNALYPKTPSPRMVAGAPVSDDVLKCTLKPLDPRDYPEGMFDAAQWQRLNAVFPTGVCDYNRRGVEQVPLRGTWLRY